LTRQVVGFLDLNGAGTSPAFNLNIVLEVSAVKGFAGEGGDRQSIAAPPNGFVLDRYGWLGAPGRPDSGVSCGLAGHGGTVMFIPLRTGGAVCIDSLSKLLEKWGCAQLSQGSSSGAAESTTPFRSLPSRQCPSDCAVEWSLGSMFHLTRAHRSAMLESNQLSSRSASNRVI
jgi:hypothetical protein